MSTPGARELLDGIRSAHLSPAGVQQCGKDAQLRSHGWVLLARFIGIAWGTGGPVLTQIPPR